MPAGVNVFKVAHTITAAIRANGIKGPVTITAFGDVVQMSRVNQEALSSTGINIAHVPHGGKNSADRSLLVDLMYWVSQNPPPAHLFLISGDRDFASILHRLRMNNYNILLASREGAPNVLCSAASIMWNWDSLVREENLAGKHFNQPPDGPYGSWYGHYKGPLLDPFSVAEQPAISRTVEPPEPASDKLRPVPKPVVRQIRHILKSYPEGVSITELRAVLSRSPVTIDKDLYGYKKFSRFLLSMPNILKLQSEPDGQFLVCGSTPKAPEPFVVGLGTSNLHDCKNGDWELSESEKLNVDERPKNGAANSKSPSSPEAVVDQPSSKVQQFSLSSEKVVSTEVQEPLKKVQQPPPIDKNVISQVGMLEHESHPLKQDSMDEVGFFKKLWLRWFGGRNEDSDIKSQHIPQKCSDSGDISQKISKKPPEKPLAYGDARKKKVEEKNNRSPKDGDPAESVLEKKTAESAHVCGDKSTMSPGVLSQIVNWCKFGRSRPDSDLSSNLSSEKLNQINNNAQQHEVFLKESFWSDMESFMDSPRGSVIVSNSSTRKQMAESLKEEGPLVLRNLSECDLLDLVDLLISEKKWVEEYPSEKSPFKLSGLVRKKSSLDHSHVANGLRSIFFNTPSKSDQLKVQKHDEEKKGLKISYAGVSASAINKNPTDRSRNDILADCQKLVDEILKEYPEGYNLGWFRKLFIERYGYHLDIQKLGYQKLATLLQIMPGVKIESRYMLPSNKVMYSSGLETSDPGFEEANSHCPSNSDMGLSDTSKKSDDSDSQWEELGPVSNLSFDRNAVQSGLKGGSMKETEKETYPDYEPLVSDDEFSDSEGDASTATQPEGQGKPEVDNEDSSLLQILDSWYSSKEEGDNNKNKSQNVDGMVDCSTDGVKPSALSEEATTSATSSGNIARKQRPKKQYSFVSDPLDNEKDKLIDGILGSLKKSGEPRVES